MKKLSLQWRITLMTALLIGVTCVAMNCLISSSGRRYMDSIGETLQEYSIEGEPAFFDPGTAGENDDITIIISGAQQSFITTNWCITAAVTLLSGVLAYFVTGRALKPLVLEEPGVQIYSLEELCYYIYNNIYILTNAFLDEKLIAFIRTEIKEPLLADKLEQLKCENAGLAEAVVTILKYVDYYDTAEIEQVKDLLAMLDTQNVYERMKMRADRFLEKGCYYSAISNYDKIVNGERDINLSGLFYAKVYHNLGTAYARMFFFEKAAKYFEEAYKIGQHEKSRKCYLAACRMAEGEEQIQDMQAPEEEQVLQRELELLTDNARYSDEYRAMQKMEHLKSDGEVAQYYKAIDDCMDRWKAQYKRYTS